MSDIILTTETTPSTPAALKKTSFFDSSDQSYKYVDEWGFVYTLTRESWPRNHLANGQFEFAQRQAPGTLTSMTPGTAARAYGADRWFAANSANDVQFQQVDTITAIETGTTARYYGKYKKLTSSGKIMVGQILTADGTAGLRGMRVRLAVKMKRTVAGSMTVRLGLAQLNSSGTADTIPGYAAGVPSGTWISSWNGAGADPTLGTNVAALTPVANTADGGTISGTGMSCVLSGTMTRYSACFDVPTSARNLIVMVWADSNLAAADELNLTECTLTAGLEIVDWTEIPALAELQQCQRHYTKSFPIGSAPVQNFTIAIGGHIKGNSAQAGANAVAHMGVLYALRMRVAPTITLFNPAAANAFLRQLITPSDATATSATSITDSGFDVTATGLAAWAKGDPIAIHYTADAEL